MSGCGCRGGNGAGPFSKGKELVEFVYHAHGGTIRDMSISRGAIETNCQGCGAAFRLETYLGSCPVCAGVHAVAPMNPTVENIQYGGKELSFS